MSIPFQDLPHSEFPLELQRQFQEVSSISTVTRKSLDESRQVGGPEKKKAKATHLGLAVTCPRDQEVADLAIEAFCPRTPFCQHGF